MSTPELKRALAKSRHWAHWSTADFNRLRESDWRDQLVAVLPVAAIEQHGPHLPLLVDTALVDGVIERCIPRLGDQLPALFLPTQCVGKSNEHAAFPGTLTFSASTLMQMWLELGACVAKAGVRRLLLLNSHGGQITLMEMVARELRVAHDMLVVSSNWFSLPMAPEVHALFTADEHRFGIHAGDVETSMMLALHPDLVDMSQARDFRSTAQDRAAEYPLIGSGSAAKMAWQMQDLNTLGAAGNATLATAAKGHAVLDEAAARLADLIAECARLPLSSRVGQASGLATLLPTQPSSGV